MPAVSKSTDGNFRVLTPGAAMEFTGERMTSAIEGQIEFEHLHRYCLARDLCQDLDVLDVASGEGYGSAILAGVARSVVGVDIDEGAVAHASGAYQFDNLRFLQGSATALPIEDASVDAVVSFETLEHLREHDLFASEVRRVLRPGGIFVVSTPDRTIYSAKGEHFNRYHLLELTESEFGAFLSAHFTHAFVLQQRAVFGSVIAAPDGAGWRSYERREHEYVEASKGLTRAPYLIGVASDAELPRLSSTVYLDRRNPEEVWRGYVAAPLRERERDEARAGLAAADERALIAESAVEEARRRAVEAESAAEEARRRAVEAESATEEARRRAGQAETRQAEAERREAECERAAQDALSQAEARLSDLHAQLETARMGWLKRMRLKSRPIRRAVFGGPRTPA